VPVALTLAAGVAVPPQELGDLGLQRGLEHQPHRRSGHLLEVLQQAASLGAGDQLVDLGTDGLAGRYSCGHGCRSSFLSRQLFEGTYARRLLHQRMECAQ
jgi:hypothetical protein